MSLGIYERDNMPFTVTIGTTDSDQLKSCNSLVEYRWKKKAVDDLFLTTIQSRKLYIQRYIVYINYDHCYWLYRGPKASFILIVWVYT